VIWGLMHGGALVVERMLGITGPNGHLQFLGRVPAIVSWLITFHFVCLTWVFFRAPSLDGASTYLTTLVSGEAIWSTTVTPLVALMLVFGAFTQLIPNDWFERLELHYDRASLAVKIALPFAVIFLVAIAAPGGVPPFIYFQF
jgi:alginate O-acetyltransferase complex protein AlgI